MEAWRDRQPRTKKIKMKIREGAIYTLQRIKRILQYLKGLQLLSFIKGNAERFPVKRMDWYIINKFIGTYVYSILLIISISIVFDVNENLAKFTSNNAPLRAIVFDYYANFVRYFANLFSPLFVFIAVIFFTSKLAGNSEIIFRDYRNAGKWYEF